VKFSGKVGNALVNKWLNFGGDPDHRLDTRDCLPDSSLLGDTESGINRLRCATLQCKACTSRRRHSNCDVITSPADDRQPRQTCLAEVCTVRVLLVTFCVSRRRRKMYCGHASVCLSAAVRPHYYTDADVTSGPGRGCPLVVHCWADLQSGHGLRAMAT